MENMISPELIPLDAGSGGRASHRLISGLFVRHFSNPALNSLDDAALLAINGPIAMSTDSYVIDPPEFPGGNIGSLAVHGTVNDVSMLGARPLYLSCGFILEEGLDFALLERIVAAMAEAAREAGVSIVTGDTKVVPKGAADKIFINTTGIGSLLVAEPPRGNRARPGDAVLISGSIGEHGLAIMASRENLALDSGLVSDSASLNRITAALLAEVPEIHVLRDPTRGGLASTLNEIAGQSGVVCEADEGNIPVSAAVRGGCSMLGLDPLYLANEGKFICILPEVYAERALTVMRRFPQSREAALAGRVLAPEEGVTRAGQVLLRTRLGGRRLLGMLEGAQLPRIC